LTRRTIAKEMEEKVLALQDMFKPGEEMREHMIHDLSSGKCLLDSPLLALCNACIHPSIHIHIRKGRAQENDRDSQLQVQDQFLLIPPVTF
jgi:hypothetical protein